MKMTSRKPKGEQIGLGHDDSLKVCFEKVKKLKGGSWQACLHINFVHSKFHRPKNKTKHRVQNVQVRIEDSFAHVFHTNQFLRQ